MSPSKLLLFWVPLAAAAMAASAGCSNSADPSGLSEQGTVLVCIDSDKDGFGAHCSKGWDCNDSDPEITIECLNCANNDPGCACPREGKTVACGVVSAKGTDGVSCVYGSRTCHNGTWGECNVAPNSAPKSIDPSRIPVRTAGLGTGTDCVDNPCDPYCQQFCDNPDITLGDNDAGLVSSDGGVSLVWRDSGGTADLDSGMAWDTAPDGPMPAYVSGQLADAGALPDGAFIYHELNPGTDTAQDPLVTQSTLKQVDVYILLDTTGSMDPNLAKIKSKLTTSGGIIDTIRQPANLPDAWFGAGRFEDYNDDNLYGSTGAGDKVYTNAQVMTGNASLVQTAINGFSARNGNDIPESWVPAMWSIASGRGLWRSTNNWWTPNSPACALAGGIGYACFRPTAIPVIVVMSDAPSHNGPGGSYAIPHAGNGALAGASAWPTPVALDGKNWGATPYTSLDVNNFQRISGTTSGKNSSLSPSVPGGNEFTSCGGKAGPESVYEFTLTKSQFVHFDTAGTGFDTVLYILNSSGTMVACNDDFYGWGSTSSVQTYLAAGTYRVVVDGYSSDSYGSYTLHVNSMTEDENEAVALPSYNQTIAALNAIGAKFIGIDLSGKGCTSDDYTSNQWYKDTTFQMQQIGVDTGSLKNGDPTQPFVYQVNHDGDPCHTGDPDLPGAITQGVIDVANYSRVDVTADAVDMDNATDFDYAGAPGTPEQLTPFDVNDASFVATLQTLRTPASQCIAGGGTLPNTYCEWATRCNASGSTALMYKQCLPGTTTYFVATFQVPPAVVKRNKPQIFKFDVRLLADGASVLSTTPVVIVVPPNPPAPVDDGGFTATSFVRDYDTAGVCPPGSHVVWGKFIWDSITPYDSNIQFFVRTADTAAGLVTATETALATASLGPPNTEVGDRVVDTVLNDAGLGPGKTMLRVRALLTPSSNKLAAPTLFLWKQEISCQPSE